MTFAPTFIRKKAKGVLPEALVRRVQHERTFPFSLVFIFTVSLVFICRTRVPLASSSSSFRSSSLFTLSPLRFWQQLCFLDADVLRNAGADVSGDETQPCFCEGARNHASLCHTYTYICKVDVSSSSLSFLCHVLIVKSCGVPDVDV